MTWQESFIKEGIEKGLEQGLEKGKTKTQAIAVKGIIKKMLHLLNSEIAEMINVSVDFVKLIRSGITDDLRGRKFSKKSIRIIENFIEAFPQLSDKDISEIINIHEEKVNEIRLDFLKK